MHDEGIQGSLFGSLDDEVSPTTEADALRVCALNINNPSRQRAQTSLNWLLGTGSNVLVLTEMKASDGSRLIISGLEAEGFDIQLPPGWTDSPYFTLIAPETSSTSRSPTSSRNTPSTAVRRHSTIFVTR